MAAVRADLSLAEPLGKANAAMTWLKAAVSSSTSKSISSFNCCAFTAQSLKYLSLSSQPRFPADKLATIPPREAPNAPINAATEPPPGAGESLSVSLQPARSRTPPHTSQSLSHVSAFLERGSAGLFRRPSDFPWLCHRASLPGRFLERRRQRNLLVSPL